ncbi:hypothetical protein H1R20_g13306, partial [Candolleomyces eurysporus]
MLEEFVQTRLPPEILSNIFMFCQANSKRGDPNTAFNRDWIRVSHVCRQWRDVALGCPDLWSTIQLDESQEKYLTSWYASQLERAENYPLAIEASIEWIPSQETIGWVVSLLPRITSLDVQGHDDCVMEFLTGFADLCAPALLSISIDTFGEIPPSLFGGGTPQLQFIRLEDCSKLPVASPIFQSPSLTHLELTYIIDSPPWPWIHGLLQGVSGTLNTLIFDHVLPNRYPKNDNNSLPILELSRLQQISLFETFHILSGFLNSIRIPASTRVDLWISQVQDEVYYEDIYAALSNARSTTFSPRGLLMTQGHSPSHWIKTAADLRIEGWEDRPLVKSDRISDQPPLISLTYTPAFMPVGLGQWVKAKPSFPIYSKQQFSIPGLSSLHLESLFIRPSQQRYGIPQAIPTHPTFWSEIAELPELSTIMIDPDCVKQFIRCLKEDSLAIQAHPDGTSSAARRRFPALKIVFFEGYNARNVVNVDGPGRFTGSTFETLEENIRLRAGIGKGFESVKFFKWEADVDDGLKERLSSFIDSVQQFGLSASCEKFSTVRG